MKIPDVPRGLKDSLVVGGSVADGLPLQWQFSFRYRDMAVFNKNVNHFTFDVPGAEPNGRILTAQIWLTAKKVLHCSRIGSSVNCTMLEWQRTDTRQKKCEAARFKPYSVE